MDNRVIILESLLAEEQTKNATLTEENTRLLNIIKEILKEMKFDL